MSKTYNFRQYFDIGNESSEDTVDNVENTKVAEKADVYTGEIPQDYQWDKGAYGTSEVTPTTRFDTFSKELGGGEYAHDTTNPEGLFKSIKKDTVYDKIRLREGKSSKFYEVDHIVPVWAGGSDNDINKETLLRTDHYKKTKVGAVARTLYFGEEISLVEAVNMTRQWRDKDVDKLSLKDNGEIDSENPILTAQIFAEEFKKPPKFKLSDWWENMKKGPDLNLGDSPLAQFGEGFISELALGYVNPTEGEYETDKQKTIAGGAQMAGQVLGGIASWAALSGLASAAWAARAARGGATVAKLASAGTKVSSKIGGFLRGSKTLGKFSKHGGEVGLNILDARVAKALQQSGIFAGIGQLHKDEERTFNSSLRRLASDATFGVLIGSSPKTARGTASMLAGIMGISMLEDPDPKAAVINTLTVAALHGMGKIGGKNKAVSVDEYLIKRANEVLKNTINFDIKPGSISNSNAAKRLAATMDKKLKPFREDVIHRGNTTEQIKSEMDKINVAARNLYESYLSPKLRYREKILDMQSTRRLAIQNSDQFANVAAEKMVLVNKMKGIKKDSALISSGKKTVDKLPIKDVPVGEMNVTGIGPTLASGDFVNLRSAKAAGLKAGDKVFLRTRPDLKSTIEAKNSKLSILNKYKNPDKNVQVLYQTGNEYLSVGMMPRKSAIFRDGYKLGKKGYDPKLNKDNLSDTMGALKMDMVEATVKELTFSQNGKVPHFVIELTKSNWANSYSSGSSKIASEAVAKKILSGAKKLVTRNASDEIRAFKFSDPQSVYFGENFLKPWEKALNSNDPATLNSFLSKFFVKDGGYSKEQLSGLIATKGKLTVNSIVKMFKSAKKNKTLTAEGYDAYNFYLAKGVFYDSITDAERTFLNSLKLVDNKSVSIASSKVKSKTTSALKNVSNLKEKVTETSAKKSVINTIKSIGSKKAEAKQVSAAIKNKPVIKAISAPVEQKLLPKSKEVARISAAIKKRPTLVEKVIPKAEVSKGSGLGREASAVKTTMGPKAKAKDLKGPEANRYAQGYNELRTKIKNDIDNYNLVDRNQKHNPIKSMETLASNAVENSKLSVEAKKRLTAELKSYVNIGVRSELNASLEKAIKDFGGYEKSFEKEMKRLSKESNSLKGYIENLSKGSKSKNAISREKERILKIIEKNNKETKSLKKAYAESPNNLEKETNRIKEYYKIKDSEAFDENIWIGEKANREKPYAGVTRLGGLLDSIEKSSTKGRYKKIWQGLSEKVKNLNAKDVPIVKGALKTMTTERFTLSPEQVRIGNAINSGNLRKLPSELLKEIRSLRKKYPKTVLKFYPAAEPTPEKWRSKSYNLFQDVTKVLKKDEFIKILKENGIKSIKREELPLVDRYLRTGKSSDLPTRLSNIIEEGYQAAAHSEKEITSVLKNVQTKKDLIGEQDFSPVSWALNSVKNKSKNTEKQIEMAVDNLWPQIMTLIKTGKDVKISPEAAKINEGNKLIMSLLNKSK